MDKFALVTGAYRGIGLEVSRQLARRGFHVFLAARRRADGEKAAAGLRAAGGLADFVALDVTDPESVQAAAAAVAGKAARLDVLVNNAAAVYDGDGQVLKTPPEKFIDAFRTNALGPALVTQAFAPLLAKSPEGRVINVSSGAGALGDMGAFAPAYSVSKTALNAVTRQFAAALKDKNIAVNSVCPGWVRTEMGGPNAPRSVEEGAAGILWLALDAPHSLTGRFLRDGKEIPW